MTKKKIVFSIVEHTLGWGYTNTTKFSKNWKVEIAPNCGNTTEANLHSNNLSKRKRKKNILEIYRQSLDILLSPSKEFRSKNSNGGTTISVELTREKSEVSTRYQLFKKKKEKKKCTKTVVTTLISRKAFSATIFFIGDSGGLRSSPKKNPSFFPFFFFFFFASFAAVLFDSC